MIPSMRVKDASENFENMRKRFLDHEIPILKMFWPSNSTPSIAERPYEKLGTPSVYSFSSPSTASSVFHNGILAIHIELEDPNILRIGVLGVEEAFLHIFKTFRCNFQPQPWYHHLLQLHQFFHHGILDKYIEIEGQKIVGYDFRVCKSVATYFQNSHMQLSPSYPVSSSAEATSDYSDNVILAIYVELEGQSFLV